MNKRSLIRAVTTIIFSAVMCSQPCPGLSQEKQVGTYTLKKRKSNSEKTKTLIAGRLLDLETGEQIHLGAVAVDGILTNSDTSGRFSLAVTPGKHLVSGRGYPYRPVSTKYIRVKAGETLFIEFRLLEDKRPTIN